MSLTAFIMIGNSDDKLTQLRWHQFYVETNMAIRRSVEADRGAVHGAWVSEPASAWQNACWCVEISPDSAELLKFKLGELAGAFGQDSIAWAEAKPTEFLGATEAAR
jgi:hypothetical protein